MFRSMTGLRMLDSSVYTSEQFYLGFSFVRLNSSQQQAVEYVSGPCLVLAGAGSGKTRVIINKIAYLIRVKEYLPRHIVAVTFTNKAAREMKERIAQSLSKPEARGLKISTFHTLGLDIVRREYKHLGIKANF